MEILLVTENNIGEIYAEISKLMQGKQFLDYTKQSNVSTTTEPSCNGTAIANTSFEDGKIIISPGLSPDEISVGDRIYIEIDGFVHFKKSETISFLSSTPSTISHTGHSSFNHQFQAQKLRQARMQ